MQTERPNVRAKFAMTIIWLCASAPAVAQSSSDDSDSPGKPEEATTVRASAARSSSAATDTGEEVGVGCREADDDWSPQGQWSGKYQVVGENLNVVYTVNSGGEIDMQLYLTPLADNFYHITDARWQERKLEFSKDSDTHCFLSRETANRDFEGHCEDSEGTTTVRFISLRALRAEASECEE